MNPKYREIILNIRSGCVEDAKIAWLMPLVARCQIVVSEFAGDTLCSDGAGRIFVGPKILDQALGFCNQDPVKASFLIQPFLVHELYHVLLGHHARGKDCQPKTWNIAGDACIDSMYPECVKRLKDPFTMDGVTLASIKWSGDPTPTTDEVYAFLKKNQDQEDQSGKGKPKSGQGNAESCGSIGKISPDKGQAEAEAQTGKESPGLSDGELQQARQEIAEKIRANPGSVPAGIRDFLEAADQPSKVDWRQKITRILSEACSGKHARLNHARPWRRQAAMGFGSDSVILPATKRIGTKVAIIVDTSGSMHGILQTLLPELQHIVAATGSEATAYFCDTRVYQIQKINPENVKRAKYPNSGGGTDLRPAFEAALSVKALDRPRAIIVLTDTETPWPNYPDRAPVPVTILTNYKHATVPAWATLVQLES